MTRHHNLLAAALYGLGACLWASLASAYMCPATPEGTAMNITNFDPAPAVNEPALSPSGLLSFAQQKGITDVSELLSRLPAFYRKYYAFMRTTRGDGHASLRSPRLVFFGPDARLMMNVGTDSTDPEYKKLDLGFLDKSTGVWEFSQLDFSGGAPALNKTPARCTVCHGTPARPIWGTYLEWPGTIGDDPRPGEQAETLIDEEARTLNDFRQGGGSNRLRAVRWAERPYSNGVPQFLPDNSYGYALTISNNQIGQAQAESIYLRIKQRFPQRYLDLREAILMLGPLARAGSGPSSADLQRIADKVSRHGGRGSRLEDVFSVLGVNLLHEISLARLATEPQNQWDWNAGSGNVLELVYALVLNDLALADSRLVNALKATRKGSGVYGIWECPNLGENVWDILRYRMTQGWKLKGAARALEHSVAYALDNTRIQQPLFDPTARTLYPLLATRLAGDSGGAATYTIRGRVSVNGRLQAGVRLNGANCSPTQADGIYQCVVDKGFTGTIVPSYVVNGRATRFSPAQRRYAAVNQNYSTQSYAGALR